MRQHLTKPGTSGRPRPPSSDFKGKEVAEAGDGTSRPSLMARWASSRPELQGWHSIFLPPNIVQNWTIFLAGCGINGAFGRTSVERVLISNLSRNENLDFFEHWQLKFEPGGQNPSQMPFTGLHHDRLRPHG